MRAHDPFVRLISPLPTKLAGMLYRIRQAGAPDPCRFRLIKGFAGWAVRQGTVETYQVERFLTPLVEMDCCAAPGFGGSKTIILGSDKMHYFDIWKSL